MIWTERPYRWVLWFQICIYYHYLTLSHFNALLFDWLKYWLLGEGNRLLGLKSWKWKLLSRFWLLVTPWAIQSIQFSRSEYWSTGVFQNTGVGSLSLLQGIFPTQGSNPGLPHCRRILHQLSHKGSQRMLEWVAYPFCNRSSLPRNWTDVSSIAGRIFPNWAISKVLRWTKSGC